MSDTVKIKYQDGRSANVPAHVGNSAKRQKQYGFEVVKPAKPAAKAKEAPKESTPEPAKPAAKAKEAPKESTPEPAKPAAKATSKSSK